MSISRSCSGRTIDQFSRGRADTTSTSSFVPGQASDVIDTETNFISTNYTEEDQSINKGKVDNKTMSF